MTLPSIKKMMENIDKLKRLGIEVKINTYIIKGREAVTESTYFELFCCGSVKEFNFFCKTLFAIVEGESKLFDLIIKLRNLKNG